MFCTKCGTRMEEDAKFCKVCGRSTEPPACAAPVQVSFHTGPDAQCASNLEVAEPLEQPPVFGQEAEMQMPEVRPVGAWVWLLIVLLALATAAASGAAFWLLGGREWLMMLLMLQ